MKNECELPQQHNKEINTLFIELREGEKKKLKIYKDTNPEQLAYEFCLKNNLDFDSLQQLTFQIKQSLLSSPEFTHEQSNYAKENQDTQSQYEDKPDEILISNINIDQNGIPHSHYSQGENNNISENINSIPFKVKSHQCTSRPQKQTSYLSHTVSSQSKTKILVTTPNNTNTNFQIKSNETSSFFTNLRRPQSSVNINNINTTLNYGERLYHKGLKLKEKTKEKINILKTNIYIAHKKNNTFQPKINKISYNALSKRFAKNLAYNNEDNIINYKHYKEQKLNDLKQKYSKEEFYSFTPMLNKRSLTMEKFKKPNTPRFEQLYNTYKKQKTKIEAKASEIYNRNKMFKPKVNNYQCPYTNISFEERQKYYLSKSKERQKILSDQLQNPSDAITGQLFFHPEINSNYERCNADNYDCFENLYKEYQRKEMKLAQQITEQLNSERIKRTQGHVNVASVELIEMKKVKAFRKIFRKLDNDKDNLITKLSINVKTLPKEIQNIIEPILTELVRENLSLNEDEFMNECFKLYECLEFVEKRKILDYAKVERTKKRIEDKGNFTFRPKINNNYYANMEMGRNCYWDDENIEMIPAELDNEVQKEVSEGE